MFCILFNFQTRSSVLPCVNSVKYALTIYVICKPHAVLSLSQQPRYTGHLTLELPVP